MNPFHVLTDTKFSFSVSSWHLSLTVVEEIRVDLLKSGIEVADHGPLETNGIGS